MKKLYFVLIISMFSTFVFAQVNLQQGLVAYYPFNGNAYDESGNGYNGTVNGAVLTTDRFGNSNSAYEFDGVDNRINTTFNPHSIIGDNSPFSINLFVEPDETITNQELVGAYHNNYRFYFAINNGIFYWGIGTQHNLYSSTAAVLSGWQCATVVFNGVDNVKIYVNGILKTDETYSGNGSLYNLDDTPIGGSDNSHSFNGKLDDIRIYDRVLTEEEIIALYNEGIVTSLNVKVFMEGPFNGSTMNTCLNPESIPLSQPFNDPAKWNYQGTESVTSIPNADIVDWVLIELRETPGDPSTALPETMIARQAAFILNNGSVVGLDGSSHLFFNNEIAGNLYVVVYCRNHLPIMSSGALAHSWGNYSWDFTTSSGQAYGINAQKEIGGGVYGMFTGDINADGTIDINDINIWRTNAGQPGYYPGDVNLNTQTDNEDKNDFFFPNIGEESQVPD
jgi:hypothetical protein